MKFVSIEYKTFAGEKYIRTGGGVKLRVLQFGDAGKPHVLFLPGWVTRLETNYPIIEQLVENGYCVDYVETRDKKSSIIPVEKMKPEYFTIGESAKDVEMLVEGLGLLDKDYFMLTSSYGGVIASHFIRNNQENESILPRKIIFMVPALEIKASFWMKIAIRTPVFLHKPAIWLFEKYMKWKFAHPDEPEEHYKFKSQLYDFEIRKVQLTAIGIDKYGGKMFPIKNFDGRCLVVAATRDLLHPIEEMVAFAESIGAEFVDLLSNKYTHGHVGGELAARFFQGRSFADLVEEIHNN